MFRRPLVSKARRKQARLFLLWLETSAPESKEGFVAEHVMSLCAIAVTGTHQAVVCVSVDHLRAERAKERVLNQLAAQAPLQGHCHKGRRDISLNRLAGKRVKPAASTWLADQLQVSFKRHCRGGVISQRLVVSVVE